MPTLGVVDLDRAARDYRRALAAVEAAKQAAKKRVHDAQARADDARRVLAEAMIAEADNGTRPVDIQRRTGYTKERVRQILRAGGVEPN